MRFHLSPGGHFTGQRGERLFRNLRSDVGLGGRRQVAADIATIGVAANPALYSFAGPRVGDLAFAAEFNRLVTTAWRVVNTEDIVTTVPLATPALAAGVTTISVLSFLNNLGHNLNYEHVGSAVNFTTHTGSILGNHELSTYSAALAA